MPKGPPPKPSAIRVLEGNPGHRPIIEEARVGSQVLTAASFPPPEGLPKKPAAVWQEIVPELVEIGLVRSLDSTILEALCRAVARAREAEEILDADGLLIEGARGRVTNPAHRIARDSWALALRIAGDYGLTAVARLRVGAAVLHQRSLAEELESWLDLPDEYETIEGEAVEVEPGLRGVLAELEEAPKAKPKAKPKRKRPAKKSAS
jgi:P27 family predicted phage terminase small subunit